MNYFEELNAIDVGDKTEKKNGLTYLSWAWAWGELKKRHPKAFYTIYETADGMNYFTDGRTAWVKTGVTVPLDDEPLEHIEYLPIMDFKNASIPLERVTSFDVNKAIQRSLTKACARHGVGLYIYAGEDLPEAESGPEPVPTAPVNKASGPENGNVQHTDKLPLEQRVQQAINGAPAAPPPEPPKPETPAAFISRSLKEITAKNAGFDFMKIRAELIKGGVIEDIPSATMNMEQAKSLIQAIEKNLREAS